jgi:YesN/AraC family two-component response regulator
MYRILIADDEAIERIVLARKLKKLLAEEAHEILQVQNGREALEVFEAEQPQILILDIRMPGMSGLEAAEQIRKKSRDAVIIFLTAFDDFSYAKKAFSVRALDYLLKPCDESELFSVVEEAVRIVKEREEKQAVQALSEAEDQTEQFGDSEELRRQEWIRSFIESNYMRDLSIQEVSGRMGYSEVYFCKLFKQYFGVSFVSYLTDYRIRKACAFLKETDQSVRRIGCMVGYEDSNYFTKVFRRITGKTPTEYRADFQG